MNAYDYDRQTWVSGAAGEELWRKQLQEQLGILQGERGAEYARFVGTDREAMTKAIQNQLGRMGVKI